MSVKFLLDTKTVKLIQAMPGYFAWCEELDRLIWIDCSETKIGTVVGGDDG